jgi:catechol 1,2-dioxygenase
LRAASSCSEPGNTLLVSGTIRSTDGEPLGGAMLDMWQSDAEGAYSPFDIPKDQASWNLRARVIADEKGRFDVQTWDCIVSCEMIGTYKTG